MSVAPAPPLVVAIDFKQPQSYLALGPTRALAAEVGIEIDWQPFSAPPLEPPSPAGGGDDRGTRHRRFRSLYRERDLKRYAEAQGLVMKDVYRAPDSRLAGMGLLRVKARALETARRDAVEAFIERVFAGYWAGALDIEDPAAIRGVVEQVVGEAVPFDTEALGEELQRVEARLREAGVFWTPSYLVGEELFIGREHLPMIRWLLEGKVGPPPA